MLKNTAKLRFYVRMARAQNIAAVRMRSIGNIDRAERLVELRREWMQGARDLKRV